MERASRARRRNGADVAARVQDGARGAQRAGIRGAADRRDGAGDQHPCRQAGPPFSTSRPDPAGIEAMARLLAAAKTPAIVAGDDVARAGATDAWRSSPRARRLGMVRGPAWPQFLPDRSSACRGTLAFDAPGVAKQFANNDLVLMVGGPFFEEVWYAPGSPFPAGCKVLQIESARRGWPTTSRSMPVSWPTSMWRSRR